MVHLLLPPLVAEPLGEDIPLLVVRVSLACICIFLLENLTETIAIFADGT
jgi:hypothetical protein